MNEVLRLVGRQIAVDARGLPRRCPRVAACGTVEEVRRAAHRALPRVIFDFVDGAAGDEYTARRNVEDFAALEIAPHALVDVSRVDCSTTVLGRRIALPLIGAPTGLCGLVHRDGEVALAKAMHGAGSIYCLSAMSSYSIEELAAATPGPTWFQMYVWRDRGLVSALLERARAAAMDTLVMTVDVPTAAGRDRDRRNGFGMPPRATLRSVGGAIRRPRWTWDLLRHPRLTAVNVAREGDSVGIAAYINAQFDPSAGWADLEWFREQWPGHVVVKGILRPEDAARAVALGADAVVVSNHGGRQLDHAPSAVRALPAVVDAVGSDAEVYMDGGVRRGSDIVKALALGARACLAGRALVLGLGVAGEVGVARVVQILGQELRTALMLAGVPGVGALDRDLLSDRTVRA